MVSKNIPFKKNIDVPSNVILVLLILTIILSAISTWVVLDTINQVKQQYLSVPSIQKGQISMDILPRPGQESTSGGIESRVTGGITFEVTGREQ